MRTIMISAGAALGLALAGCGDSAPDPANEGTVPGPESFQNRLEALPEGQRNAVFIRAIRDSGEDCQHVESSSETGEHQGMPVWTARCAGGSSWTIVIGNDGTAYVLNPAEAQLVGDNAQAAQNRQGR